LFLNRLTLTNHFDSLGQPNGLLRIIQQDMCQHFKPENATVIAVLRQKRVKNGQNRIPRVKFSRMMRENHAFLGKLFTMQDRLDVGAE
jgi:hypothetical protein